MNVGALANLLSKKEIKPIPEDNGRDRSAKPDSGGEQKEVFGEAFEVAVSERMSANEKAEAKLEAFINGDALNANLAHQASTEVGVVFEC